MNVNCLVAPTPRDSQIARPPTCVPSSVLQLDSAGLPHSRLVRGLVTTVFPRNVTVMFNARRLLKVPPCVSCVRCGAMHAALTHRRGGAAQTYGSMYSRRVQAILSVFMVIFMILLAALVVLSLVSSALSDVIILISVRSRTWPWFTCMTFALHPFLHPGAESVCLCLLCGLFHSPRLERQQHEHNHDESHAQDTGLPLVATTWCMCVCVH